MASGQEVQTGWNYYGCDAQYICVGPVKTLWVVRNGDTVIFTGPVYAADADGHGRTILNTTIGTIYFYWGSDIQDQDALLAGLTMNMGAGLVTVPMPSYKSICYAVLVNVSFGGQTVPPTLVWEYEKASSGLDISAHELSGDSVLPEVMFEALSNTLTGAGISSDVIDVESFKAACETVIAEDLGVSPVVDEASTLRDILGQWSQYIDAILYHSFGLAKIALIRKPSATYTYPTIDETLLLDEPTLANNQFDQTFNHTLLSFTDRDNKWETAVEPYFDGGNFDQTGEYRPQDIALPFITRRSVAKRVAARIGAKAGLPQMTWDVVLKNQKWTVGAPAETRFPVPGDLCRVNYLKLGISNRTCRVMEVEWPTPRTRQIRLRLQEENTRNDAHDYIPPADDFSVPHIVSDDGTEIFTLVSASIRLATIPTALKGGKADGWLLALNRPTATTLRVYQYFAFNPLSSSYLAIGSSDRFPVAGTIIFWERYNGRLLVRVRIPNSWDVTQIGLLNAAIDQVYVVTGQRSYRSITSTDQHQPMALWGNKRVAGFYQAVSATIIDLEFDTGSYSTPSLALQTIAAAGVYPGTNVYFGQLEDFFIVQTDTFKFDQLAGNADTDTALVRAVKAPVANHQQTQSLGSVSPATYDRDDTSMSPTGTLSPDWGARSPTAAEYVDIEEGNKLTLGYSSKEAEFTDVDTALGATVGGTHTATQKALWADIDTVLGGMLTSGGLSIYNEAP